MYYRIIILSDQHRLSLSAPIPTPVWAASESDSCLHQANRQELAYDFVPVY
jgi:hypothetical protein